MLGNDLPSESHIENLEYAKSWGFNTSSYSKKFSSIEDVIKYIKDLNQVRDTLPFEIDGVVVKVDNINLQNELGNTAKVQDGQLPTNFRLNKQIQLLLILIIKLAEQEL